MALYRLFVPVLPAALLAGARLAEHSTRLAHGVRTGAALLVSVILAVYVGWPARHVAEHRLELVRSALVPLAHARSVAALDVGWVGAATRAPVLDLAGVTDPVVARLPGGHTSKRIPEGLLESRRVDTVVLLLAPGSEPGLTGRGPLFARAVEARIASFALLDAMTDLSELRLGGTEQRYLIVARR
jgi:hypothetical protein